MERGELKELHYIATAANLKSILKHGILSNNQVASLKLAHKSVADPIVQERREKKKVPGGLPLHDYVNLYINARNKMMNKVIRVERHDSLMVLGVSTDVLDIPDVVITDHNAASGDQYVRYSPSPEGLAFIDRERVFAKYWTHLDDYLDQLRHGSEMCAEVLVPTIVEIEHVETIYVSCDSARAEMIGLATEAGLPVVVRPGLFFQ